LKGLNQYHFGLRFGYKFLVKSKVVIEPSMRVLQDVAFKKVDLGQGPQRYKSGFSDLYLSIKIGYRFDKKKKSDLEDKDGL